MPVVRFLRSLGFYGSIVGLVMTVIGLSKQDRTFIVVGIVGFALSLGWWYLIGLLMRKLSKPE
jgi:hypothetical protein